MAYPETVAASVKLSGNLVAGNAYCRGAVLLQRRQPVSFKRRSNRAISQWQLGFNRSSGISSAPIRSASVPLNVVQWAECAEIV